MYPNHLLVKEGKTSELSRLFWKLADADRRKIKCARESAIPIGNKIKIKFIKELHFQASEKVKSRLSRKNSTCFLI